jgi:4-amino-4-deoxy-L-arabinose transferase-like glycosyltransferase
VNIFTRAVPRGFATHGGFRHVNWPLFSLVAVVAISLAVDLWWLHNFRGGYPLDIDESRYLELGLRLSDGLTSAGPVAFWHVWSAQHDFGPLLPLVSVAVYVVFGHTVLGGLATQLVFFVLLVVSSYGIGTRLTSPTGGALVAIVVACAPAVIDFTRTYQFAITAAAVLAAATYALLASEAFTRLGWSLLWGFLLGLTPLARTMAIAFMPAQLIAAVWLISARPETRRKQGSGLRRSQRLNFGVALVLGVITAATWLARSWHSVYSYLTNFGYGVQSAHFSSSGSRLTVGYWTREAVNAVREDVYLPLGALLALSLIAALSAALAKHRRRNRSRRRIPAAVRRWAVSDAAIVLFILLEGYVVVSSSRNEGVGFRLPLIPALVALAVAAVFAVPWRVPRRLLIGGLIGVSALNLIMKADLVGGLSDSAVANVPGLGKVPVLAGQGYIQGYVLGSLEARPGPATQPLPISQRAWMPAYRRTVEAIFRLARRGHHAPVVALATDEPLINANDLTLAARLQLRRDLLVTLLPGPPGAATLPAYEQLIERAPGKPNTLITVTHVGLSYFALSGLKDIEQGLLERASAAVGFACGSGISLPDGRVAVVSSRTPKSPQAPMVRACAPRVTHITPSAGAAGVPTTTPVTAVFSLPMQTASLRHAFTLTDTRSGRRVRGTVSFFGDIALSFRPRPALAPGTRFTVTLGTVATAATGDPLRAAEHWSFTTRLR